LTDYKIAIESRLTNKDEVKMLELITGGFGRKVRCRLLETWPGADADQSTWATSRARRVIMQANEWEQEDSMRRDTFGVEQPT
jgi:hypothetical protein